MPKLRKKAGGEKTPERKLPEREFQLSDAEKLLLKKIGLRIHKKLFEQEHPSEWLAFRVEMARSTIQEIIAGRRNPRLLTLNQVVQGLGYKSLVEFFKDVE